MNKGAKMNKTLLLSFIFIFYVLPLASANTAESTYRDRTSKALSRKAKDSSQASIINGTDWKDTEGRPIMAHEGDIARFDGVF